MKWGEEEGVVKGRSLGKEEEVVGEEEGVQGTREGFGCLLMLDLARHWLVLRLEAQRLKRKMN